MKIHALKFIMKSTYFAFNEKLYKPRLLDMVMPAETYLNSSYFDTAPPPSLRPFNILEYTRDMARVSLFAYVTGCDRKNRILSHNHRLVDKLELDITKNSRKNYFSVSIRVSRF